eukprot:gb/GEZN01000105.1/.p1 GENE.gb/GEZN01000105.1/~~gb/GEZN01000105.1/.p1  ORF type:complete len:2182 (-),score=397.22 gb/GEZN01000105.1/:391-6936(-)
MLNLPLRLEHLRGVSIQRKKPWTAIKYRCEPNQDDEPDPERKWRRASEFIVLDHKGLGANSRIGELWHSGKSPRLWFEQEHGVRFLGVAASCNGAFVLACKPNRQLVLWHTNSRQVEEISPSWPNAHPVEEHAPHNISRKGFFGFGRAGRKSQMFRKASNVDYASLGVQDLHVADDGSSLLLFTKTAGVWLWRRGGFYNRWSGWTKVHAPTMYFGNDVACAHGTRAVRFYQNTVHGQGWRITQIFLSSSTSKVQPCEPHQARALVLCDMSLRFDLNLPPPPPAPPQAFSNSTSSRRPKGMRLVQEEHSPYLQALAENKSGGWFGTQKQASIFTELPEGQIPGGGALRAVWDSSALCLACVVNTYAAEHARVYFFTAEMSSVVSPPPVAGLGEPSSDPKPADELEQGHSKEVTDQQFNYLEIKLDNYLKLRRGSTQNNRWMVSDAMWVGGHAEDSCFNSAVFLAVISTKGELMLLPRLCKPSSLLCVNLSGGGSVDSQTGSQVLLDPSSVLGVPFVPPWDNNSKQEECYYSLHPHPTEPRFLCSDGFAVTELSTGVRSVTSLLRAVINNTAPMQTDMDALLDMWRMGLSSAEWLGPDIRNVLESLIQRLLVLCAAPDAPPNLPQQTLAKFLSLESLGWNNSYQSGFHACVALTERLFVWLLMADRLEAAFQVLHFAGPALSKRFPRISIGTRYAAETARDGAAAVPVDLQRTRHRLWNTYELRNQWLALHDRLQQLDVELGGLAPPLQIMLASIEPRVHFWLQEAEQPLPAPDMIGTGGSGIEVKSTRGAMTPAVAKAGSPQPGGAGDAAKASNNDVIPRTDDQQEALQVVRTLYWSGEFFDARDALTACGPRYLFASLCLDFHLADLGRSLSVADLLLETHALPSESMLAPALPPTLSNARSPPPVGADAGSEEKGWLTGDTSPTDQQEQEDKDAEREALADKWGPMYAALLLARAMASWFCNQDVALLSPFAPAPLPPQPAASSTSGGAAGGTGGANKSNVPAFSRDDLVVFKRDSPELVAAVAELEADHRWTPFTAVRYFRWTRQATEAIAFCQRLVREIVVQEDLMLQHAVADDTFANGGLIMPMEGHGIGNMSMSSPSHGHSGLGGPGNSDFDTRAGAAGGAGGQIMTGLGYNLARQWSVREVGELAVATAMAEVGHERIGPGFFWLVLQWHLALCLNRWDLNGVLSLFNAHAALIPSQLTEDTLEEKLLLGEKRALAAAEAGEEGKAKEEEEKARKDFQDLEEQQRAKARWTRGGEDATCPPPLRMLFASVRRRLWPQAVETWMHSLRLSLLHEVAFPLMLKKTKPDRAQLSSSTGILVEDDYALRTPRGQPVPLSLFISPRSPIMPVFHPNVEMPAQGANRRFSFPSPGLPTSTSPQPSSSSPNSPSKPHQVARPRQSEKPNSPTNRTTPAHVPNFALGSPLPRITQTTPKIQPRGISSMSRVVRKNKPQLLKSWWDEDREANQAHSLIGFSQSGLWTENLPNTSPADSPRSTVRGLVSFSVTRDEESRSNSRNGSSVALEIERLESMGSLGTMSLTSPAVSQANLLKFLSPASTSSFNVNVDIDSHSERSNFGRVIAQRSTSGQSPGLVDRGANNAEDLVAHRHDDSGLDEWLQQAETFLYFLVELSRTQGRTEREARTFAKTQAQEVLSLLWFLVGRHTLRVLFERLRHLPTQAEPASKRIRRARVVLARECARWCIRLSPFAYIISDEGLNKKPIAHLQSLALQLLNELEVGKELEEMMVLLGRLRLDAGAENQYRRVLRKIEAHDSAALQRVHLRLERDAEYQLMVFVAKLTPLGQTQAELISAYCARLPEVKKQEPFVPHFSIHEARSQRDRAEFYPAWRHRLFDSDYPLFLQQCLVGLDQCNYRSRHMGASKDVDSNTLLPLLREMLSQEADWEETANSLAQQDAARRKRAKLKEKLAKAREMMKKQQQCAKEQEKLRRLKELEERQEIKRKLDLASAREPRSSLDLDSASPLQARGSAPVPDDNRRGSEPDVPQEGELAEGDLLDSPELAAVPSVSPGNVVIAEGERSAGASPANAQSASQSRSQSRSESRNQSRRQSAAVSANPSAATSPNKPAMTEKGVIGEMAQMTREELLSLVAVMASNRIKQNVQQSSDHDSRGNNGSRKAGGSKKAGGRSLKMIKSSRPISQAGSKKTGVQTQGSRSSRRAR